MSILTTGAIGMSSQLLVDPNTGDRSNGYQIDWDLVGDEYRTGAVKVTLTAAGVAADTALTVTALTGTIRKNTAIKFGAGKVAVTTADALAGATTIPIQALAGAIANSSVAYAGGGPKRIPAGTDMGKSNGDTRKIIPRVVTVAPAFGILIEDAVEGLRTSAATGFGVYEAGFFWENRLPSAIKNGGTLPSAIKTELGSRFWYKTAENNAPTL